MGRAAGKRVRRGGSSRAPQAGSPTGGRMGNSRPPRWPQPGAARGLGAGTIPVFSCPWESQDFSFGGLQEVECGSGAVGSCACSEVGRGEQGGSSCTKDSVPHMD